MNNESKHKLLSHIYSFSAQIFADEIPEENRFEDFKWENLHKVVVNMLLDHLPFVYSRTESNPLVISISPC